MHRAGTTYLCILSCVLYVTFPRQGKGNGAVLRDDYKDHYYQDGRCMQDKQRYVLSMHCYTYEKALPMMYSDMRKKV